MSEGSIQSRQIPLTLARLRLVMPPTLFAALSYPFTRLGHFLFPAPWANCIIAGAFTYCKDHLKPMAPNANRHADVFYDCTHYALHHTKLPAYLREVKKYHLAHHYKNYELGFGVTSTYPTRISHAPSNNVLTTGKLWDVIFNTVLPV